MINTKDNIWVEGFDSLTEMHLNLLSLKHPLQTKNEDVIYSGKTSDIPEEVARNVCELQNYFDDSEYISQYIDRYKNYRVTEYTWFDCTAKQSIQSALTKPDGSIYNYCIIFKK